MTYTPLALVLPNPAEHAYSTRIGSKTVIVAGHAGAWVAALVSPLRGYHPPFGRGVTRDEAVEALL